MSTPTAVPQPVCVACAQQPVGFYELVCDQCRPALEQAGVMASPQADTRIQIGPTDV